MIRVQGFFATAPVFSRSNIPAVIKAGLAFIFCLWFYDAVFTNSYSHILDSGVYLFVAIGFELVIGMALGFLVNLVFDVIVTCGQLLGIQIGQSSSNIFNAALSASVNPGGLFFSTVGMLAFLTFGGLFHIAYLLKQSFVIIPLVSFSINFAVLIDNFYQVFDQVFVMGLKFVLPLIALMFIVDIFVAIFSKILPQASMFFLIMPNKVILGAILMMFMLSSFYIGLENYFSSEILDLFDQLFELD